MGEIAGGDERFRVKIDGPDGAPVILMSHSLGCDLTMWDAVVPALARTYRVVRYDSRGHGGSVVVARPTSIAELADDALAILDDLGVERAHFVGLSMGGMVGQWLLRFAPERLDRVVLCNTAAMMGPPDLWNARIRAVREGMAGLTAGVMERWFTPRFRKASPAALARIVDVFEATAPDGYASCSAAIRDMDQRWGLREAIGDVTVIVGAHDPGTTPAIGKAIADAIPGARLVTLDAAHISAVERPDDFAAAVLAALAAPTRKARRAAAPRKASTSRKPASPTRAAARARPAARRAAVASASAKRPTAKPAAAPAATAKTATVKAATVKAGAAKPNAAKAGAAKAGPPTANAAKPSQKARGARPALASASKAGKSRSGPAKASAKAPAKSAAKRAAKAPPAVAKRAVKPAATKAGTPKSKAKGAPRSPSGKR